jgi:outer membrane protein insertion porin family
MSVNVSEALDKTAFESLEKEFNKVIGKYYSLRKLTNILQKIDRLSQLKELQFINHRVNETLIGKGIEVKIDIFEGQKFIIERINIVGNNVTNDSVIRSEMIVDEGDPYSALLLNKSINKLKGRGIFGQVESKITEGSSPDLKVLEITVEERATGEISAGAGFGTDGTAFMFGVNENNWLGRGIKLQSVLNISPETISGNLKLNNPNYNYTGNAVFLDLDVSASDLTDTSGYKSDKTGFAVGTEFEQYEDIYFSPSLTATYENVVVQSTASSSLQKMAGTYTNLDFGYGIVKDKRNQAFQPSEGYRTKFLQSIPLIMDNSSLLNGLEVSKYHSFSEDFIGALKFYGRTIHGLDGEDVRIANRLYIPAKRLRGFQNRKVGPKDGTDYVGGNYVTSLGFEAALPNLLPEATKTDIILFMDTANLWHVDYSESVDDTNKIRSSIGIAANMFTTIGPLSFTFAQDLSKANTDITEFFNFRLGTSF